MKQKKKILFLHGQMVGGGAEKVLTDLLNNIDYSKYDVDLALVKKGGVLFDRIPKEVKVIRLWKDNSFHYFMAVKFSLHLHSNILFRQRLNSRILRKDYDAEIAFLEGFPSKLIALRETKAKKISWIHVDLHNFHASSTFFYNQKEERATYSKMDEILTVSEDCKKGFLQCFPQLANKTGVIFNPIDIKGILSKATETPSDLTDIFDNKKINIITVARLHHQKNPTRLLQVAKMAKDLNLPVKFTWIGDGEMFNSISDMRKEMKLEEMVELAGFKKNPYPYIKAADILLLPSDAEGFGLVLCEAMALETPVISTPTAGPVEIIGNNEYGIITDFTPESIIDAIKNLLSNSEKREKIVSKGLERVKDFSVEKAMENLYSHV